MCDIDHVRTRYYGDDLLMSYRLQYWGFCCRNVYLVGLKGEKEPCMGQIKSYFSKSNLTSSSEPIGLLMMQIRYFP